MSDKTGIEWTDATWNPIRGCSRVSEGCRNCYAETVAKRFSGPGMPYEGLIAKGGQWNGNIRVAGNLLDKPLRWQKPRRIFANSMSDLFHETVPEDVIDKVFAVMASAHWHTFQVLTKRPERMREYLRNREATKRIRNAARSIDKCNPHDVRLPLPNVWLGVSVEDQETADARIPLLLQTPAAVRWISAEPLLEPINIFLYLAAVGRGEERPLDWVVCGGESGRNARPMHAIWARLLRDQCRDTGVPFLFKQWGEYAPNWLNEIKDGELVKIPETEWMDRQGKKKAGRELDGRTWDEYPEPVS